jgi:hypothetical protein
MDREGMREGCSADANTRGSTKGRSYITEGREIKPARRTGNENAGERKSTIMRGREEGGNRQHEREKKKKEKVQEMEYH